MMRLRTTPPEGVAEMSEFVRSERVEGVAVVRLDRPERLNAIGTEIVQQLDRALDDAASDTSIGAVVVAGEGRAFSAGADIAEFGALATAAEFSSWIARLAESYERLERFPKPTIAAVDGTALGGGLELALACDLRIASARARFGLPEIKLGLLPGAGRTQRLPRRLPLAVAKHMIFTGDPITADDAFRLGLVNQVVPDGDALASATELAQRLAAGPPLAFAAAKRLLDDGLEMPLDQAIVFERETVAHLFATDDAREGVEAFLNKRTAVFRGS
jgi:enoyl-CoA hydratase